MVNIKGYARRTNRKVSWEGLNFIFKALRFIKSLAKAHLVYECFPLVVGLTFSYSYFKESMGFTLTILII